MLSMSYDHSATCCHRQQLLLFDSTKTMAIQANQLNSGSAQPIGVCKLVQGANLKLLQEQERYS